MVARLTAASVALGLLGGAGWAQTARAADVHVTGPTVRVDAARLGVLVDLELGALVTQARVDVALDGDHARVTVSREGATPASGEVDLRGAADRERALALFVGELSKIEEVSAPAAVDEAGARPPVGAPARSTKATLATPRAGWRGELGLWFGARVLLRDGTALATPHVELGKDNGRLRVGLLARYAYGAGNDALGTVTAHTVSGGAAATLRILQAHRVSLGVGPRAEVGVGFANGAGAGGRSTAAPVLSGALAVEGNLSTGPVRLRASAEGGWLALGLNLLAADRSVVQLSGPFLGATLGVAIP